jgi:uncharacterized protein (TIGR03435 family)
VYTLTIGKSGAKIRELRGDEPIPTYSTRPQEMATFKGTFDGIVSLVRLYADRPVMNETGITGRYEYVSPPGNLVWRGDRTLWLPQECSLSAFRS